MAERAAPAARAPESAAPDRQLAVRVRGLRKSYGGAVQALDGVDLDVRRGEVLAVLGPNGAGKTTLVEILEGHRTADAGEVSVLGHDPARRERAFRARIGIVLQEDGVEQALTVREAVELHSASYPAPRPAARITPLIRSPWSTSSTSRRPASTRPPGASRGSSSRGCARAARRSC